MRCNGDDESFAFHGAPIQRFGMILAVRKMRDRIESDTQLALKNFHMNFDRFLYQGFQLKLCQIKRTSKCAFIV